MVYDLGIIKRQKAMASPIAAAGGVITNIGSSTIHTFLSSGVFQPLTKNGTSPQLTVSYLVVGGGGGGGVGTDRTNGGGGAGGLISSNSFLLSTGSAYTVTVGAGGVPGSSGTFSRIAAPGELTYSTLLNGTSQYLTVASNAALAFGTGDFTVEMWLYLNAAPSSGPELFNVGNFHLNFRSSNTIAITNDASVLSNVSNAISVGVWTHIAAVRSSGNMTIYLNGVANTVATGQTFSFTQGTAQIGSGNFASGPFINGYFSNLRVLKGTALYTSAFTPPTAALTSATTGTSLLTLQDATFIDNSGLGLTVTAFNSPTTTSTVVPPLGQFAYGGGAGGGVTSGAAAIGGSGGGAKHGLTGAVGISGQGQAGGTGYDGGSPGPWTAGGGGGKGGVGGNGSGSKPGDGGVAGSSSISGTLTYYAGGGGGGFMNSTGGTGLGGGTSTTAQKGGGGDGNTENTTGAGSSGTANTGGGGGGSGSGTPGYASGTGGSGVVVISYPNPAYTAPLTKQSDPYFNKTSLLLSNQELDSITIDYLIVGGGGGGGYSDAAISGIGGGGGGAGGVVERSNFTISTNTNTTLAITVGAGGLGSGSGNGASGNNSILTVTYGSITTSTGYGGGYGSGNSALPGGNGGSGGGNSGIGFQSTSTSGGYGNNGGPAQSGNGYGAAGGGAGAAPTGVGSDGGAGRLFSNFLVAGTDALNSTATVIKGYYGGGGAAGNWWAWGDRNGGVGGGGKMVASTNGFPGLTNTGGGGGGASKADSGILAGGAGGSGVVVIRHPTSNSSAIAVIGTPVVTSNNSYKYYIFNNSGSLQFPARPTNNKTFLDSSANALTITPTGTPTQGTFSPYGNNWSNYFNGSTDYLTTPANTAFAFGTGDFTVEAWVYTIARIGSGNFGSQIAGAQVYGTSADWLFNISPTGTLYFQISSSATGAIVTTSTVPLNSWTHVALVRVSGIVTIYINGINAGGSASYTTSISNASTPLSIGGASNGTAASLMQGYISNLRIIKGTALYTSNFTPATAPLPIVTNTVLLTAASNRFMDKSSTATITAVGTPSVQRFSPFNNLGAYNSTLLGSSAYFNGSTDYLTLPSNSIFAFGTGNFTIECWFYLTGTAGNYAIYDARTSANSIAPNIYFQGSNNLTFMVNGPNVIANGSATSANCWHHFALVRNSGSTKMYQDGVQIGSTYTDTNTYISGIPTIGHNALAAGGSNFFPGYITDFRIVTGTALYTTSFTPPAAPVSTIDATTSTGLVLNCTNAGIYDATTQNEIIPIGSAGLTAAVTKFNSRSMYFNGTTDYLTILHNPSLNLSTGAPDFTVELWVNFPNFTASKSVFSKGGSSGSRNSSYAFSTGVGGSWQALVGDSGSANIYNIINSAANLSINTWYHIAMVRYGTNLTLYINGISGGSVTISMTMTEDSGALYIAGFPTASQFSSMYIDDLRITKGVARYTANFTPPTQTLLLR